jgi:hypothetical protein
MVTQFLQFQHYIQSEDTKRIYFYSELDKFHQNIGNHLQGYSVTTQKTTVNINDDYWWDFKCVYKCYIKPYSSSINSY